MTTSTETSPTLVALDTNILLRLRNQADPEHEICRRAVERAEELGINLAVSMQVLNEFWVVATRPKGVNGFGFEPSDAARDVQTFLDTLTFLPDPPDLFDRWFRLVTEQSVCGKQGHDARLAALLEAHRVRDLMSLNFSDFLRYPHLLPRSPEEFLDALPTGESGTPLA